MSHRLYCVDFHPHKWLAMTAHLPPAEKGMLITVCALIYAHRKPVDNDQKHIARLAGCSPRMARSLIDSLIGTNDLIVDACGKLCQKTCMEELNIKISRLEKSAKGGRTSGETRRENSKNNDLDRSTPLPSPSNNKPSTSSSNPREDEVLKKYDVMILLSDNDRAAVRKAAPGWDIYNLAQLFNEKVRSGKFARPDKAGPAFAGWAAKYTKKKPPQ